MKIEKYEGHKDFLLSAYCAKDQTSLCLSNSNVGLIYQPFPIQPSRLPSPASGGHHHTYGNEIMFLRLHVLVTLKPWIVFGLAVVYGLFSRTAASVRPVWVKETFSVPCFPRHIFSSVVKQAMWFTWWVLKYQQLLPAHVYIHMHKQIQRWLQEESLLIIYSSSFPLCWAVLKKIR